MAIQPSLSLFVAQGGDGGEGDDGSFSDQLSDPALVDALQGGGYVIFFTAQDIPVGDVFASEYCRAWQTKDLAFDRYEKVPGLNFAPSEEYSDDQVAQMRFGIMPLLTAVPTRGTNTVIVGHDDVFDAATGIYPEPQGIDKEASKLWLIYSPTNGQR